MAQNNRTGSFPFMNLAEDYNLNYGLVLRIAHHCRNIERYYDDQLNYISYPFGSSSMKELKEIFSITPDYDRDSMGNPNIQVAFLKEIANLIRC